MPDTLPIFFRSLVQDVLQPSDLFLNFVLAPVHIEEISEQDYPANGESREQIREIG